MRLTLTLAAVIAALCFSQAFCLIALGKRDAALATCARERKADAEAARSLAARDAAVADEAAKACGVEGNDAFNRGVSVGRAVCEARR